MACQTLNPAEREGFVVRDSLFRRVKIKSPQYHVLFYFILFVLFLFLILANWYLMNVRYVALAQLNLKNTMEVNAKHILQIVRNNEGGEFLAHFPQYASLYSILVIIIIFIIYCNFL